MHGARYFKGTGSQERMFLEAESNGDTFFVQLESKNFKDKKDAWRSYASYASIETFKIFERAWTCAPPTLKCFNELIRGDRPARLYFDIEWLIEVPPPEEMSRAHKTARQRVRRIVGIVADLLEALSPGLEPERAVVVGSSVQNQSG